MAERPVPVILCGGSGTRLWPLSRASYPKQFLKLIGETSLLQETLLRVSDRDLYAAPVLVCNAEHRFLVAEQAQSVGVTPSAILLEPEMRNTAPAIGLAAHFLSTQDEAGPLLVLPSDHVIGDHAAFHQVIATAQSAAPGQLITFGISPDRAETGFGYIEQGEAVGAGVRKITRFIEKPDKETAEIYLKEGRHLWNSGMFLFDQMRLADAFQEHAPDIWTGTEDSMAAAQADLDFLRPAAAPFKALEGISIDYAIMEQVADALVVPADIGWDDVGSWNALSSHVAQDDAGNRIVGNAEIQGSENAFIWSTGPLVAAQNLRDLAIIATDDAVLVTPLADSQSLSGLVHTLAEAGQPEALAHGIHYRPWGHFEDIDAGSGYKAKRLVIKPGGRLSLQSHDHRAEHWVVVEGSARVTNGDQVFELNTNESTYIPQGQRHRLENPTDDLLVIVEVQTGAYLEEDDIHRYEDQYNRSS